MTPPESPRTKLTTGIRRSAGAALDQPEALERELAQGWTDACVSAHLAAGAAAEFAVRLLRLAAPAPLLRAAAHAMADEAALSSACMQLARQYGGTPPLLTPAPKCDSAPEVDRSALVLSTLRRACITATVEASCAREGLEHCQEVTARELLLQLEQTRARSAQLGWRFLSWALRDASRELIDQVRVAVLTALGSQALVAPLAARDRQLLRHGLLGFEQRALIEQRVLRDVVLPCMESVLARTRLHPAA
jgi:hypothetical protein